MSVTMTSFMDDWLEEVLADQIIAGDLARDIDDQARANQWAFSVSRQQAAELSPAMVLAFLHTIIVRREQQIIEQYGMNHPMTFYCWFDELAAQLRFSLVSAQAQRLPFACPIEHLSELEQIVQQFLQSPHHDGIRFADLEDEAPLDENPQLFDTNRAPLSVWTKQLPSAKTLAVR